MCHLSATPGCVCEGVTVLLCVFIYLCQSTVRNSVNAFQVPRHLFFLQSPCSLNALSQTPRKSTYRHMHTYRLNTHEIMPTYASYSFSALSNTHSSTRSDLNKASVVDIGLLKHNIWTRVQNEEKKKM